MNKLVRLWKRPSRDGKRFSYVLIYQDEQGKARYESLGHTDRQKPSGNVLRRNAN